MVMGIGLAANASVATAAIAATIFYVMHHIIVKSSLFLIGGIAERVSGTQELKRMGGVLDLAPGVAGLFLVSAMSLAGMPPFSGFLSKLVLLRAGLGGGNYVIVGVSLVTSFLTLYSMAKIWNYAFWGRAGRAAPAAPYRALMVPTAALVAMTIGIGFAAQPFLRLAADAADDITNPRAYVTAVLGERP
jgi:multicomponent Na+:H+ antiporter subunit D